MLLSVSFAARVYITLFASFFFISSANWLGFFIPFIVYLQFRSLFTRGVSGFLSVHFRYYSGESTVLQRNGTLLSFNVSTVSGKMQTDDLAMPHRPTRLVHLTNRPLQANFVCVCVFRVHPNLNMQ